MKAPSSATTWAVGGACSGPRPSTPTGATATVQRSCGASIQLAPSSSAYDTCHTPLMFSATQAASSTSSALPPVPADPKSSARPTSQYPERCHRYASTSPRITYTGRPLVHSVSGSRVYTPSRCSCTRLGASPASASVDAACSSADRSSAAVTQRSSGAGSQPAPSPSCHMPRTSSATSAESSTRKKPVASPTCSLPPTNHEPEECHIAASSVSCR